MSETETETTPEAEVVTPAKTDDDGTDNWHSADEPTIFAADGDDETVVKPDNWHSA